LTRAVTIEVTSSPEPMPGALSEPPLEEVPELLVLDVPLLLEELPPSALSKEAMLLVAELVLLVVVMAILKFR